MATSSDNGSRSAAGGPGYALPGEQTDIVAGKICGGVADRVVEDATLAPVADPGDGAFQAIQPREVLAVDDVDLVRMRIAFSRRVSQEVSAEHQVVTQAGSKRRGGTVPCGNTGTGFHRLQEMVLLRVRQVLRGQRVVPAQDDQVVPGEITIEGEDVLGLLDVKPEFADEFARPVGDVIGAVAGPTAVEV